MTDEIIDPGLNELLNSLTQAENAVSAEKPAEKVPEPEVPPLVVEQAPTSVPEPVLEIPIIDKVEEEPKVQSFAQVVPIDPNEELRNKLQGKLLGLIDVAITEGEKLSEEMEVDRKKCDDVYNMLAPKILSGQYSGSDAIAVVQVLQVKADISTARTKKIDSMAKLLLAVKSNTAVGTGPSNGSGGGSAANQMPSRDEITALLNKPIEDDE